MDLSDATVTFPLLDFPREIIDRILSFKALSPCALLLWMTGDSRIHHALATGLTTIDLVNKDDQAFCRFPTILRNLRALRDLTVHRGNCSLPCMRGIQETIRNLSPTLIRIKIRVLGVGRLFATSHVSTDNVSTKTTMEGITFDVSTPSNQWTMKSAFPILESLDLDRAFAFSPEDLLDLPSSLTSLSTHLSGSGNGANDSEEDALATRARFVLNLPRSLAILKGGIRKNGGGILSEHYKHLPPRLIEFHNVCPNPGRWITATPEELLTLPQSLTQVSSETFPISPTVNDFAHFPPNLKTVSFTGYQSNGEHLTLDMDVKRQFPQLESLRGSGLLSHYSFRSMPSTLTSMSVKLDLEGIKTSDWPKSLTRLEIEPINISPLDALPATLLHLAIDFDDIEQGIKVNTLASLPKSLLSLRCPCADMNDEIVLPPKLTELVLGYCGTDGAMTMVEAPFSDSDEAEDDEVQSFNIQSHSDLSMMRHRPTLIRCFPFDRIPKSVTKLELECGLPASQVKFLPRRLKSLKITSLFEDDAFDILATCETDTLDEIRSIGRAEGILLEENCRTPPDAHSMMIALLPRTLRTFECFVAASSYVGSLEWYQELPPRIENLVFVESFVYADFVYKAPLQHIKELSIILHGAKDDHIRALPRRTSFVYFEDEPDLTKMAAAYWPHAASSQTNTQRLNRMLRVLRMKRLKHADDEDSTQLRKLYGTDAEYFAFLEEEEDQPKSGRSRAN